VKRTRQEQFRLAVLVCLIAGFFLVSAGRLVQLQILKGEECSAIVDGQSRGKVAIPAARGMIYDRYGRIVAKDVAGSALYAYPHNKTELSSVSAYLERFFDLKSGSAVRRYGLAVRKFRYITRRLDDERADRIVSTAPRGLYLREENRREYPFGNVGKQVVGFTDIDNHGQSGVEYTFDSVLAGQTGWADILRDGLRNTFRVRESALVKPVRGTSMVLTIDWRLQGILEEELRRGVEKYNAKSGMAVLLECRSGDILAIAHFDPKEINRSRPTKCRAVTDQFEPGSVIKAFTAAAILDAGVVGFEDSIFCEEGAWKVGRRTLHDDKELGWLSFRDVMELSSNIGVAKCAIGLGGENLYDAFKRFGLGSKLNCGLPGESGGAFPRQRWSDYNIAALAMGHSVAVTPLQMAAGFAAIANGGDLIRPQLVLGSVDEKGYVYRSAEPERLQQVATSITLDSVRAILRGVVENGTATPANSPSVEIAGKTGTAEIPDLVNKRYFKNRFMASFAGFFPYQSPVVAGLVVVEDPKPITYGGWTSGPIFRRIAERYTVSNPDLFGLTEQTMIAETKRISNTIEVPDFIGRDIALVRETADRCGVTVHSSAAEGTVGWQYPPPDRLVFSGDEVVVAIKTQPGQEKVMSDLSGLSVRQVSALLQHQGIKFVVRGCGQVVKQSIRPGKVVSDGIVCKLECRTG